MQNVATSNDEKQVSQEYQRLKRKQSQVLSICEKKMQEIEEPDYLQLRESGSVSNLDFEEEIKGQYERPIGGNTMPPQYSKEISRYQPSNKERTRAMKDALNAVREFTSEGNLSKNGNINTTTMKEMWDYEGEKPTLDKNKGVSEVITKDLKNIQMTPKVQCELCGGNHGTNQCPHASRFSQLGKDASRPKAKSRFSRGKSKSIDYLKPKKKQPSLWRPAQSVNGRTDPVGPKNIENKLTMENLSNLAPEKCELEMGCRQVLVNKKTKAWVDEQNKINKRERPKYGRLYIEGKDLIYPDPQLGAGSPEENKKGGKTTTTEKEKDTPQPSHALQEFVKHIADPLVDKGWNLHLKFGKGESQKEKFVQGSSPQKPMGKTAKKEKVSKPQIEKQIPLEMGTGGGGGGKKGGSGSKRPPEDIVEIEDHPNEDEEDSSLETSLELEIDPQQLAINTKEKSGCSCSRWRWDATTTGRSN